MFKNFFQAMFYLRLELISLRNIGVWYREMKFIVSEINKIMNMVLPMKQNNTIMNMGAIKSNKTMQIQSSLLFYFWELKKKRR